MALLVAGVCRSRPVFLILMVVVMAVQCVPPAHAVGAVWLTGTNLQSLGLNNFSKENPDNYRPGERLRLRVAVEEWVPHVKVREGKGGHLSIQGPMANLLQALAVALNFEYTLVRPEDGMWGAPNADGTWNGMLGMVKRNEADLALGPFGITEARASVVEFSQPIMIDYFRILVKRGLAEPNPWGFLNPLRPMVWLGLSLAFVLVCVGLWTLVFLARDNGKRDTSTKVAVALHQCWEQFATLCQQTMTYVPKEASSRMLVCVWLMTVLVIMRSYSGALTSLLAVRQIPIKINSLRDLVMAKEYNLLFEGSTALTAYMSEAKTGIFAELKDATEAGRSQFLRASELFDAAFTLVKSQDYALLVEETTVRKIMADGFSSTGKCDFYMAKEVYFPLIFCIIGSQGLPIMPAINFRIQSLVEHDLYSEWMREQLQNETACLRAPTSISVNAPYNMRGLWGVFMVLFGGLFVSFITFLFELLIHTCHRYEKPQNLVGLLDNSYQKRMLDIYVKEHLKLGSRSLSKHRLEVY
ncbi:probable glutamate receptor isoform X2 [Panulirus ornatus]|uniref:probable glutamate receptor isoform X2 n=1 Tax=Panulirus ornatus TaxID=150431 RepID=UPI003A880C05